MAGTTEDGKKTSEGGRGNSEKASPAAIERYIKGIKFPANTKQILEQAKNNNAPEDVMKVLKKFKDHDYGSPIDVAKEVGRLA